MKATLVLALVSVVAAQSLPGIPQCAVQCLMDAVTGAGCGATDMQCQCVTKATEVQNLGTQCVINKSGCSAADIGILATNGPKICADYLKSLSSSSAAGGPSTSVSQPSASTSVSMTTASSTVSSGNGTNSSPTPTPTKAGSSGAASLAISAAGALAAVVVLAASL